MGMTDEGKELLERALRLAPKERAELAAKLVSSVNAIEVAASAWVQVIEARAQRARVDEMIRTEGHRTGPVTVRFDLDAEVDLERAATWYQGQPGQIDSFLDAVLDALERIRRKPTTFGLHASVEPRLQVRRIFLREFPFALAYTMLGAELRVLAVAHDYRPPMEEGGISLDALVTVEDWLTGKGLRAVSSLVGVGLCAIGAAHL